MLYSTVTLMEIPQQTLVLIFLDIKGEGKHVRTWVRVYREHAVLQMPVTIIIAYCIRIHCSQLHLGQDGVTPIMRNSENPNKTARKVQMNHGTPELRIDPGTLGDDKSYVQTNICLFAFLFIRRPVMAFLIPGIWKVYARSLEACRYSDRSLNHYNYN